MARPHLPEKETAAAMQASAQAAEALVMDSRAAKAVMAKVAGGARFSKLG
jgi:hypothetical protein